MTYHKIVTWRGKQSNIRAAIGMLLLAAGAPCLPISAQTLPPPARSEAIKTPSEVPLADDPQVAFMFLHFHDALLKDISSLANKEERATSEQAAAATMNLNVEDFEAVNVVYRQLGPLLDAVDHDGVAYRDRVIAGERADTAVLHQFQVRRGAVLSSIKPRLQNILSPAGWKAVSDYIEGPFRQTVTIRSAK